MNTEYVAWFVVLVAVGVTVVAYLALGPVPEIPAAEAAEMPAAAPADDGSAAEPGPPSDDVPLEITAAQSSPVSTTEPGPAAPSGTSETP